MHPLRALAALVACFSLAACSTPGSDGAGDTGGATGSSVDGGAGGQTTSSGGEGGAASSGGAPGSGGEAASQTSAGAGGAGGETGSAWGPDQCPEPPAGIQVGIEVGQQLPELVVKDCNGQDYSLSELCGANGLFLFAAHGWCPLCQNVSSNAESIHDSFAGQALASAIVVVQTGGAQPPTASYCQLWREQFGLEDVLTLYDPTGAILDVWPGSSSSLSAFIDQDRVIVSKLYHDGDVATIKAHIQEALDH